MVETENKADIETEVKIDSFGIVIVKYTKV